MSFSIPVLRRLTCLLAIIVTAGCTRPDAGSTDQDRAALQAGVDSAATRLLNALRADNADSVLALVTDDIVLMPPNEPVLKGKAAVRTWYEQLLTQLRTADLVITEREVIGTGDWANEISTYEWTLAPVAGGPPVTERGSYVQVWQRQPDGRWLFSREIWNSTTPLPAASQGM